ncbi:hypothetical protein [Photobacterium damselae]|uniref:hypothetical protein n=1 Tax=Photobacterium damselae TaxID=38293 RepID=UPI001F34CFE9|nr:hypothetical protein [Photobacterium damselae]UKA05010.1 hypothetical protein IHC89_22450 [Photobacterium damselae subsp. damselae]
MQRKNQRTIKKLSQRAADFLPNMKWCCNEFSCSVLGDVKEYTPVSRLRTNLRFDDGESVCAWVVLRKIFISERDNAYFKGDEWFYGTKPTPENVFLWAFWNSLTLESITNSSFTINSDSSA